MAFQLDINTQSGLSLNVYARISEISLYLKHRGIPYIEIKVDYFISRDLALQGIDTINKRTEVYTVSKLLEDGSNNSNWDNYFSITVQNQSGVNSLNAAYMYLKSLPRFQNAQDVLD